MPNAPRFYRRHTARQNVPSPFISKTVEISSLQFFGNFFAEHTTTGCMQIEVHDINCKLFIYGDISLNKLSLYKKKNGRLFIRIISPQNQKVSILFSNGFTSDLHNEDKCLFYRVEVNLSDYHGDIKEIKFLIS